MYVYIYLPMQVFTYMYFTTFFMKKIMKNLLYQANHRYCLSTMLEFE